MVLYRDNKHETVRFLLVCYVKHQSISFLMELTLCRMLEKELVVLHLKVSWRSPPGERSGLGLWNNMQVIPFQSAALTA